MNILIILFFIFLYLQIAHFISFRVLKTRTLKSRKWDLNICCGKTDGGGINADIKKHKDVPNFVLVKDIYRLPFTDNQFDHVLCSHTIEHVENPEKFFHELKRVGKHVLIVIPPMWDVGACMLNFLEHRWIFLSFRKNHTKLPKFIPMPFAKEVQGLFGQRING
ncbi:MAG: class I SAM-dependent methyltransferase [archaeon]